MPHPVISKLPMVISGSANLMGGISEIIHLAQQASYRIARNRAIAAGTVAAFEQAHGGSQCQYYLAGSDLPNQSAGDVIPEIWHGVQGVTLLILVLPNLPGRDLFKKTTKLVSIIGKGSSTSWEGGLQMLFGTSILSLQPSVLDIAPRLIWFRWIMGWILLAIGFLNIVPLGLLAKGDIRLWRHQVKSVSDVKRDAWNGKNKIFNACNAAREIDQLLGAAQYSGKFGDIYVKWNNLRKAIKACEEAEFDW